MAIFTPRENRMFLLFSLIGKILYGADWEKHARKPARIRQRRRR
jgi:hypothetical protein